SPGAAAGRAQRARPGGAGARRAGTGAGRCALAAARRGCGHGARSRGHAADVAVAVLDSSGATGARAGAGFAGLRGRRRAAGGGGAAHVAVPVLDRPGTAGGGARGHGVPFVFFASPGRLVLAATACWYSATASAAAIRSQGADQSSLRACPSSRSRSVSSA